MAFKRSSNSAGGLQAAFDSGTPAQKAAFQAAVSGDYVPVPGLDVTGTADMTSAIAAAFAAGKNILLPAGVIRANISVPSGQYIKGAGRPRFDVATGIWEAFGTLVLGRVDFDGKRSAGAFNLSVDNFASGQNAIQGLGVETRDIIVIGVNTRANNHNHLWEQNTTAALVDTVNNIYVSDCIAYQGPNGFATKMRGVTYVRCHAEQVTTQAFVAASDNINGAGILSRAQDVRHYDCTASGGNEGLRVYSRDYGSTGTVQPARNIYWNGTCTGGTGRRVRVGDFSSLATANNFARVTNDYVTIDGGVYDGSPAASSAILIDNARWPVITERCRFGSNGTGGGVHIEVGGTVTAPTISRDIRYATQPTTTLHTQIVTSNSATVALSPIVDTIIFRNTSAIGVSNLSGAFEGQTLDLLIDDAFTTIDIGAVKRTGKGAGCRVRYVSGAWVELNSGIALNTGSEVVLGFAVAFAANFSTPKATRIYVGMSGNMSSMTLTLPTCPDGTQFSMRFRPTNAGGKGIAWAPEIKWPDDITAPTTVPDGKDMLVQLYKSGSTLVVTRVQTYTP